MRRAPCSRVRYAETFSTRRKRGKAVAAVAQSRSLCRYLVHLTAPTHLSRDRATDDLRFTPNKGHDTGLQPA
jgi:hypothetical protein